MTTRIATITDCFAVYEMICDMEAKLLPYRAFADIFQKQLEDPDYECIVCEEGRDVIAVLNLRYEEQLHHAARIAEIMEFVVKAEYRNKGYGKGLLAYAERCAKENGCVQIEVACNQLRKDTHRFYSREGMKNYHFKFSKDLTGADEGENKLGR